MKAKKLKQWKVLRQEMERMQRLLRKLPKQLRRHKKALQSQASQPKIDLL